MARMFTMDDLKKGGDGDDDEGRQTNYAGAGQATLGPERGTGGEAADRIMGQASRRSGGAGGSGDAGDGEDLGGEANVITFWKNGFQVNKGELRLYEDPANAEFLSEVDKGYVPRELYGPDGKPASRKLTVDDKRGENYKPPTPPPYTAFSGGGQAAGGSGEAAAAEASMLAATTAGELVVDDSAPTTNIRINLAAGGRITGKFNHTHTVADIQAYVARESGTAEAFVLIGGFPPKPLGDPSATIADAGLVGAALRQKLT